MRIRKFSKLARMIEDKALPEASIDSATGSALATVAPVIPSVATATAATRGIHPPAVGNQFSVTTPGYLAKSFVLLVTTVTLSETLWAAISLSR